MDGEYSIAGTFDDFRSPNARLSGRVTLRQASAASPAMTGTASVTLYNGTAATETYTEVFRATREGEHGIRFLLSTKAGLSGAWEFVGELSGNRISGTQYLDFYRLPQTGGITAIGGTWSGTR